MKKSSLRIVIILLVFFVLPAELFGQFSKIYKGPDDPAGDKNEERVGWMTGNRVLLFFRNNTELSNCCGTHVSKWPNNNRGSAMTDGVALLIGAKVYISNDTIPDPWQTGSNLDTLYYIQTSYREGMDRDPLGVFEWGLYPPNGYNNPGTEYVAMSNIPESWPLSGWPSTDSETKWPGEWNGRFGRGVIYADLETFFVANDAQDQEYLLPGRRVKYYPRPGVKIGDKNPNVTTNLGAPWGGIGIRVETRGMQWSNPQTQDAIFWEYNIANISEYDLPEMTFGYWNDNGIGGNEPTDDLGYYDTYLDLAFSWDIDMVGEGGLQPGVLGFAFLESPGISTDGIDNDDDGIIDERRDNEAVEFYSDSLRGIADLEKYKRAYGTPRPRWDSDEDGDWQDGNDANGDGVYQKTEFYGDDVGTDGVGPLDLNYTGPDENGTECNHRPDFIEGLGSEPNYALTDVSESDMIGLTAFQMYGIPPDPLVDWHRDDKGLFLRLSSGVREGYSGTIENLVQLFGAGTFPLYQGRTERVSMAMVHSFDRISLGDFTPDVPLLARKKEVVQVVYERDYRFATPPEMPTLKATPADGKVILSWNDIADKQTKEPLLNNINDFEGYKLYKATDRHFSDPEVITNGFGEATLKKPIFQCDLVNKKQGFTDFGLVDGTAFYLGNDSGIQHFYVDEEVDNGVTYYYALVAYDYGIADVGEGITPYENSTVLDLDEYGNVRNKGINVAIVTPTQKAAGYQEPLIEFVEGQPSDNKIRGNDVEISVLDPQNVKSENKYKIKFISSLTSVNQSNSKYRSIADGKYICNGFEVYDMTNNGERILIENSDSVNNLGNNLLYGNLDTWLGDFHYYPIGEKQQSEIFDGIQLSFTPNLFTGEVAYDETGWITGDSPVQVVTSRDESKYFPGEYEVVFTDNSNEYSTKFNKFIKLKSVGNEFLFTDDFLFQQDFDFYVVNKLFKDENGDPLKMDLIVHDVDKNGEFNYDKDTVLVGPPVFYNDQVRWGGTVFGISFKDAAAGDNMPDNGDVYKLKINSPLSERDSIIFTLKPEVELNKEELKQNMSDIRVVPNPYVATNRMEPALVNSALNQQRRLLFTNIPAQCKIKIFTMSGVLVDEIIVDNSVEKGSVHWDLLSKEGLEIAAGVYIYHVKSDLTGEEKIGKFAVLK